jgi:ribosome-associated protein
VLYLCPCPRHKYGLHKRHTTMIQVTRHIAVDEREIEQHFIRASGPGGQNVNKVATAVQIRFDVAHSRSLPDEVRRRLMRLAGRRMTKDGILVIDARRFRTQERNRQDALKRLLALIRAASVRPKPRRETRPTLASKQRRLEAKRQRSELKRGRRAGSDDY